MAITIPPLCFEAYKLHLYDARAEKLFPLRIGSFFRTAIPNPPTFAPASVHGKMQKKRAAERRFITILAREPACLKNKNDFAVFIPAFLLEWKFDVKHDF
ncbi:hypothetical protein KNH48_10075 [Heyndrickxia coagulans]|nr:hypothetical protein KNH48_10075 [Heyndrickxia coagulans]